jgi:integrase/recombinase XerD
MPRFGRPTRPPASLPAPPPGPSLHPSGCIRLGVEVPSRRPFDVPVPEGAAQHVTLLGLTGSGKTTTAERLAEGAVAAGVALVVIDAKGASLRGAARRLAAARGLDHREVVPGAPGTLGYNPCAVGRSGSIRPAGRVAGAVAVFRYPSCQPLYKRLRGGYLCGWQARQHRATLRRDEVSSMTTTRSFQVVTPPTPSELDRSISDYLASCAARGLNVKTTDAYEATLRRVMLPYLAERGITSPAQFDQRVLDDLSTHLLQDGGVRGPLSRFSVHSYLRSVGHYLAWARKEGEVTSTAKPQLPSLPKREMVTLTREQIRAMEDAAGPERDRLIIRILADTGLRLGELLGLTPADLIEEGRNRFVRVLGKGNKERMVPLSPGLYSRLRRYAERGRPQTDATDRIFTTLRRSRKSGEHEALKPRAVEDLTLIVAAKAGITDRPVNPHAFRHAFATWALRRGMNPLQLKEILGHESLDMISRVYSHLNHTDAAAAMMAVLRSED